MSYTYTDASFSDKESLYLVFRTVMREFIIDIWGWEEDWQVNDFNSNYLPENIIIVKNNHDIVGYCQFEEKSNYFFIRMLVVLPGHQSKGIGKRLLLLLKEKSDENSKHIQLNVFKINNKAKMFYIKQGLKVIRETDIGYIMESTA